MTKTRTKYFVGIKPNGSYHVFKHHEIPTEKDFGLAFQATIGPFKTKYGAIFMAKYGKDNPCCQHVNDAERLASITWGEKWKKSKVRVSEKEGKRVEIPCEALFNKGDMVVAVHPLHTDDKTNDWKGFTVTHPGTGYSFIAGVPKNVAKKIARTLYDRIRDHGMCEDMTIMRSLFPLDSSTFVIWLRDCRRKYRPLPHSPE